MPHHHLLPFLLVPPHLLPTTIDPDPPIPLPTCLPPAHRTYHTCRFTFCYCTAPAPLLPPPAAYTCHCRRLPPGQIHTYYHLPHYYRYHLLFTRTILYTYVLKFFTRHAAVCTTLHTTPACTFCTWFCVFAFLLHWVSLPFCVFTHRFGLLYVLPATTCYLPPLLPAGRDLPMPACHTHTCSPCLLRTPGTVWTFCFCSFLVPPPPAHHHIHSLLQMIPYHHHMPYTGYHHFLLPTLSDSPSWLFCSCLIYPATHWFLRSHAISSLPFLILHIPTAATLPAVHYTLLPRPACNSATKHCCSHLPAGTLPCLCCLPFFSRISVSTTTTFHTAIPFSVSPTACTHQFFLLYRFSSSPVHYHLHCHTVLLCLLLSCRSTSHLPTTHTAPLPYLSSFYCFTTHYHVHHTHLVFCAFSGVWCYLPPHTCTFVHTRSHMPATTHTCLLPTAVGFSTAHPLFYLHTSFSPTCTTPTAHTVPFPSCSTFLPFSWVLHTHHTLPTTWTYHAPLPDRSSTHC